MYHDTCNWGTPFASGSSGGSSSSPLPRFFRLGLLLLTSLVRADFSIPVFDAAATTNIYFKEASHTDFFSTSFQEICNVAAVVAPLPVEPEVIQEHVGNITGMLNHSYLYPDYLDNPYAGSVFANDYTQTNKTIEFIRDNDDFVTPHTRDQVCHFAVRLTRSKANEFGAAYYREKQNIAYGFTTTFTFEILHRSEECTAAGLPSPWCKATGGDGFAFIIQNSETMLEAVSDKMNGLGYDGLEKAMVIEFDTYRNTKNDEAEGNHISVHVPKKRGEKVLANHFESSIAYTADIPDLQEGQHFVEIEYTIVTNWDQVYAPAFKNLFDERWSEISIPDEIREHFEGRPGLLTLKLDERPVIAVMLDLAMIVEADGAEAFQTLPGGAFVGFTSSTSEDEWQAVDITTWDFIAKPLCSESCVMCNRFENRPTPTMQTFATEMYTHTCPHHDDHLQFLLKNVGRIMVHVSAKYNLTRSYDVEQCAGGKELQWNHLHPYFLGCEKMVEYVGDVKELWFNSADGTRSLKIDDKYVLNRKDMMFKRRRTFEYCIMEHTYNPTLLHFAQCNCEYCERLFNLQNAYSVFYQYKCYERFGPTCQCLEVSRMGYNYAPLQYIRTPICRGCKYTSHCSQMLKAAQCKRAYETHFIGNPLAPTLADHGFIDQVIDEGRVKDGRLRGDVCICEPSYMRFAFTQGRCSGYSKLLSEMPGLATVDHCYERCKTINNCYYFTYYKEGIKPGLCEAFQSCSSVSCVNMGANCKNGITYEMVSLSVYTNTRGVADTQEMYLRETVQTTWEECYDCLRQFEERHCAYHCGPPSFKTYLHSPAGQSCATCIFAGNKLYDLNFLQLQEVKDCVYNAIARAEDPWKCATEPHLFNGVATHFLSECPGRVYENYGVVCVPNLYAVNHLPTQILARTQVVNNTAWSLDDYQCLNAICNLSPKSKCYKKLAYWDFTNSLEDTFGSLDLTPRNGAFRNDSGLQFTKEHEQYFTSRAIPDPLTEFSFEAWVTLPESERAVNLMEGKETWASTYWREDYLQTKALDGLYDTYWASELKDTRDPFPAYWEVDLRKDRFMEGVDIYWRSHAFDFKVKVAASTMDGERDWVEIAYYKGNMETVTVVDQFFRARWLQIEILVAADGVETPYMAENALEYMVSFYEVVLRADKDIARLRDTGSKFHYDFNFGRLFDGNPTTYWSTTLGVSALAILLDFAGLHDNIATMDILWQNTPLQFIVAKADSCAVDPANFQPLNVQTSGRLTKYDTFWSGGCLLIDVQVASNNYYDMQAIHIREVEIYKYEVPHLVITPIHYEPNQNDPSSFHPLEHAFDDNPSTYFLFAFQDASNLPTLTVKLNAPTTILRMEFSFKETGGVLLCPSDFFFEVSMEDIGASPAPQQPTPPMPTQWTLLESRIERSKCDLDIFIHRFRALWLRMTVVGLSIQNDDPLKRIGLSEWRIFASSENLVQDVSPVPGSQGVTNEWVDLDPLSSHLEKLHGAQRAIDGDMDTWWGAEYGMEFTGIGQSVASLEIEFPGTARPVSVAIIYWRFPAKFFNILCDSVRMSDQTNSAYLSVSVFSDRTKKCSVVKIVMSNPEGITWPSQPSYAGHAVLGLREVQLHALVDSMDAIRPANDAKLNSWIDIGMRTKYTNSAAQELVFDFQQQYTNLIGYYLEFASLLDAPPVLHISVSHAYTEDSSSGADTTTWTLLETVNMVSSDFVYALKTFSGRYFKISAGNDTYAINYVAVFQGTNYATGAGVQAKANIEWRHSSDAAVDGDPTTYWLSEPESTRGEWRVDFGEPIIVVEGIYILWKFPARHFMVYTRADVGEPWDLLKEIRDNIEYENFLGDDFLARFVKIVMLESNSFSLSHTLYQNQPLYGLTTVRVMFDLNLAHGKHAIASATAPNIYGVENVVDVEAREEEDILADEAQGIVAPHLVTTWMPKQGTTHASLRLEIDVEEPIMVSGVVMTWRFKPKRFVISYRDENNSNGDDEQYVTPEDGEIYFEHQRFVSQDEVVHRFGFGPTKAFRLTVTEVGKWEGYGGRLIGLQDIYFYHPRERPSIYNFVDPEGITANTFSPSNEAKFAFDKQTGSTYWKSAPDFTGRAELKATFKPGLKMLIGRIRIFWRLPCSDFILSLFVVDRWIVVKSFTGNTDLLIDLYTVYEAMAIKLEMLSAPGLYFAVYEIEAYEGIYERPIPVQETESFMNYPDNALDQDPYSYWMAPPNVQPVTLDIDLTKIYPVSDVEIFWQPMPGRFVCSTSSDNLVYDERHMRMDNSIHGRAYMINIPTLHLRYVNILIQNAHADPHHFIGAGIRDLIIRYDQNVAKKQQAVGDSVWDYPTSQTVDANILSFWAGQFGEDEAEVFADLGELSNIAVIRVTFGPYYPKRYSVYYAINLGTWILLTKEINNEFESVTIPPTVHIRARYIKVELSGVQKKTKDPNYLDSTKHENYALHIQEIVAYKHAGGGGIFGIEMDGATPNDEKIFSTIAYGLDQPEKWSLASETGLCEAPGPGTPPHMVPACLGKRSEQPDPEAPTENVNELVHVAATVRGSEDGKSMIRMYRNGEQYGAEYTKGELIHWTNARLVFGVRHSGYDTVHNGSSSSDPNAPKEREQTHSAFFEGTIHSATLIKGFLSAEELRGLYLVAKGTGKELGCHCYDACPVGSSRFYPSVPIPCSGQGSCLTGDTGYPFAKGTCLCIPGYSGEACEHHCSDISASGCCLSDDDCIPGTICDGEKTKTCIPPPPPPP